MYLRYLGYQLINYIVLKFQQSLKLNAVMPLTRGIARGTLENYSLATFSSEENLERTKPSVGLLGSPLRCSRDTFWCTQVSRASDRSNKFKCFMKETAITKTAFLTIQYSLKNEFNFH